MHWLKVTGLGATPYFEMMGQLDTLKDENRALEEKLAAASRGEQDMGVRRAWGGGGDEDMGRSGHGVWRTWGLRGHGPWERGLGVGQSMTFSSVSRVAR